MKFKTKAFTALTALTLACSLSVCMACGYQPNDVTGDVSGGESDGVSDDVSGTTEPDNNEVEEIETDDNYYNYEFVSEEDGTYTYEYNDGSEVKQAIVTIEYVSGTQNCYTVSGNTITFGAVTEDSVYAISGEFYGNIVIDGGDDYKFELEMQGLSLTSYLQCPIAIESGDQVTLSAKKGTQSYIYDLRGEVSEEEYSGSVFADCDLAVQGKGELYVKSVNNNGIHSKDDLSLKNLTLQVECVDNALKGNDEVSIESGDFTLIASKGDGIKTSNSDLSKKGNQKGSVIITGGTLLIYAAC
ncbi:MAG: carbohydrate-binding domain-containing protein, partial [Candidatus Coproplasma sp.]